MKMKDREHILLLLQKFEEGETTLQEEQELYAYFNSPVTDSQLLSYRDMMLDYLSISCAAPQQAAPTPKKYLSVGRWLTATAACVLLIVGAASVFRHLEYIQLENRYGGSYMVENGCRIDNLHQLKNIIANTLSDATRLEAQAAPALDIHQTEQELLEQISDPGQRQYIRQLLDE